MNDSCPTHRKTWQQTRAKLLREQQAKELAAVVRTAGNPDWWMRLNEDTRCDLQRTLIDAMQRVKWLEHGETTND